MNFLDVSDFDDNFGIYRVENVPSFAIDPANDYFYLVYTGAASPGHHIQFMRSTDLGENWTDPITIGQIPEGGAEFWPWISADGTGRVSVAYMHKLPNVDSVDAYLVESHDRGENFCCPLRVSSTNTVMGESETQPAREYLGAFAKTNGRANVVWTDLRSGNQDIYYSRANTILMPPQDLVMSTAHVGSKYHPKLTWRTKCYTSKYLIWRRLSGYYPPTFGLIDSVDHPDTTYIDYGLETGDLDTAFYKITGVDPVGNISEYSNTVWIRTNATQQVLAVGQKEEPPLLPEQFHLNQNYPNPFNPATVISYQLPEDDHVLIRLYDALGQEVATLVDEMKKAGWYEAVFDASSLSGGVYFYRMSARQYISIKKMVVIR